jgi:type II secretory pathway pseudopilin PulG
MARAVTSRAGSSERRNGCTLIELTVMVLILAAAMSAALSRPESFLPRLEPKQTAREVVLVPREAQRRAIQGGRRAVPGNVFYTLRFSDNGI